MAYTYYRITVEVGVLADTPAAADEIVADMLAIGHHDANENADDRTVIVSTAASPAQESTK